MGGSAWQGKMFENYSGRGVAVAVDALVAMENV